ncbi:hypothetical protein KAK07_02630 [Ideonella sp. 4Y16]|uniref:hypothetical protein n=1 Tax=Ideonella alba TaxID=2824118 RepID=UPI001B37CCE0|nr:hypothetical protein [Ideonella alba]MBQ0942225.1 hypothetical protein [Ideonella alba]
MSLALTDAPPPEVNLLYPELWLLLTDPTQEPDAAPTINAQLQALAGHDRLAEWRWRHRRVRAIGPDALAAEVRDALAAGCPAVRVHSSQPMPELDQAIDELDLPPGTERLINLHGWDQPLAVWWPRVAAELTRPDAWVEVGWRLSRGARIPLLAMPGDKASGRDYQAAFKAWRAERFKLGDSGQLPSDEGNEVLEPTMEEAAPEPKGSHDPDTVAVPRPRWQTPPPPLKMPTANRLGLGVVGALGAAAPFSHPWFPVATLHGEAQAPGAAGRWPYTLYIERQSVNDADDASWLAVRVRVAWAPAVAEAARLLAHRLVLLPRLQAPVVLRLAAGTDQALFSPAGGAIARMKDWPKALPGTAATLIPLP